MPTHYHIAQINIARMLAPINDPLLDDFVAQLDAINSLADDSPGFVWRLQSDSGNDTDIAAYEDALILINMSVWESIESLQAYAYRSEHVGVFRQRRQWFKKPDGPHTWPCGGFRPENYRRSKKANQSWTSWPNTVLRPKPLPSRPASRPQTARTYRFRNRVFPKKLGFLRIRDHLDRL
jgi:hypothetical protein